MASSFMADSLADFLKYTAALNGTQTPNQPVVSTVSSPIFSTPPPFNPEIEHETNVAPYVVKPSAPPLEPTPIVIEPTPKKEPPQESLFHEVWKTSAQKTESIVSFLPKTLKKVFRGSDAPVVFPTYNGKLTFRKISRKKDFPMELGKIIAFW